MTKQPSSSSAKPGSELSDEPTPKPSKTKRDTIRQHLGAPVGVPAEYSLSDMVPPDALRGDAPMVLAAAISTRHAVVCRRAGISLLKLKQMPDIGPISTLPPGTGIDHALEVAAGCRGFVLQGAFDIEPGECAPEHVRHAVASGLPVCAEWTDRAECVVGYRVNKGAREYELIGKRWIPEVELVAAIHLLCVAVAPS